MTKGNGSYAGKPVWASRQRDARCNRTDKAEIRLVFAATCPTGIHSILRQGQLGTMRIARAHIAPEHEG
jgi:hypothetical protein